MVFLLLFLLLPLLLFAAPPLPSLPLLHCIALPFCGVNIWHNCFYKRQGDLWQCCCRKILSLAARPNEIVAATTAPTAASWQHAAWNSVSVPCLKLHLAAKSSKAFPGCNNNIGNLPARRTDANCWGAHKCSSALVEHVSAAYELGNGKWEMIMADGWMCLSLFQPPTKHPLTATPRPSKSPAKLCKWQ